MHIHGLKPLIRHGLALSLLVSSLTVSAAIAPPYIHPVNDDSNSWHFSVSPLIWIFGMTGDMTIRGSKADINATPADTVSFSDVDFLGQLRAEASRDQWTFVADATYLKFTEYADIDDVAGNITPELTFIDLGAYYDIYEDYLDCDGNNPVTLQLFAGARYINAAATIRPGMMSHPSASQSFTTPVVGARIIADVSPCLSFIFHADFGGFGIDDVRHTWSASGVIDYSFNEFVSIVGGMRYLDFDFSRGKAEKRFAMDTSFWGPILGVTFRF